MDGISVARGNIVLADHGRTIADEELKAVPQPTLLRIPTRGSRPLHAAGSRARAAAFSPAPEENPADPRGAVRPARQAACRQLRSSATSPQDAVPVIALRIKGQASGVVWTAVSDLLESTADDPHFVAKPSPTGRASCASATIGTDCVPPSDTVFLATYRVGNGTQGNVASDAIAHIVTRSVGHSGSAQSRCRRAAEWSRKASSTCARTRRLRSALRPVP